MVFHYSPQHDHSLYVVYMKRNVYSISLQSFFLLGYLQSTISDNIGTSSTKVFIIYNYLGLVFITSTTIHFFYALGLVSYIKSSIISLIDFPGFQPNQLLLVGSANRFIISVYVLDVDLLSGTDRSSSSIAVVASIKPITSFCISEPETYNSPTCPPLFSIYRSLNSFKIITKVGSSAQLTFLLQTMLFLWAFLICCNIPPANQSVAFNTSQLFSRLIYDNKINRFQINNPVAAFRFIIPHALLSTIMCDMGYYLMLSYRE